MQAVRRSLLVALAIFALTACEDDATGPQASGTVRVAAVGDAGGASSYRSGIAPVSSRSLAGSGAAQGSVRFRARVYVRSDAGEWVELTSRTAQNVTVDASGDGQAQVFASNQIEASSYSRVRVVFEEVEANLTSGLQIGLDLLTGQVRVDLGGNGNVEVEQAVDLDVRANASSTLVLDLNSSAWLSSANTQTRTVGEAAFQGAVRIYSQD